MVKGCNLGNNIYPNSTGLFDVPFNNDVERFNSNEPIHIRFYKEDPECGLPQDKIQFTSQRCIVGNQYGAGIVQYNANDILCLPLDNYIYLLFIPIIYLINKFKLNL